MTARTVRLLPPARSDLERLEAFLAQQSQRAASRAAGAISAAVLSLSEHPERYPVLTERGLRECPVAFGRYGYLIQYRIRGAEVHVARIFHARENR